MKRQRVLYAAAVMAAFTCGLMVFAVPQGGGGGGGGMGAQTDSPQGGAGGDQIVDGISETDLIARYILDGNANDRSRDGKNGTVTGGSFVDDKQFGKVLSLTGKKDSFLELPAGAFMDAENLSVVGWVYLNADAPGQRFFDFSKSANSGIYCTPTGTDAKEGFRARISSSGTAGEQGPTGARIPTGKWVHLAVVVDTVGKTLTTYADGKKVGETKNLPIPLDQAIDQKNADSAKLFIGRAFDGGSNLNGKLHDIRLYSVVLTESQVATIHKNALGGGATGAADKSITTLVSFAPQATAAKLTGVPDITAKTVVGQLPKLPAMVPGTYAGGAKGPMVRVIWPAPTNTSEVQAVGTYTVTGKVAGTDFAPKATVTILASAEVEAPKHSLEAFHLGEIILTKNTNGNDSQFIKNRDKFINTLANTNTDSFLYMFRNTFGEPQPAGARALGSWDSQTTKLRGHGTGHYLSALAQAYASTSYDAALHANFEKKMNTMIDTLYEMSQKSGKPQAAGGPSVSDPTKVPPGANRHPAPGAASAPATAAATGAADGGAAAGARGGRGGRGGATNIDGYDSNFNNIRTDYWNWGEGFISAYPPDEFIMLEKGATYGGGDNQIWAPYYTLHKILAGLLDCYEVGGNEKALKIATGMGSWVQKRLAVVPPATRLSMWNRYIAGEYGGMNEVMARLYRLTGDKQFLEGARLFDNVAFFYGDLNKTGGLLHNVDTIRGRHANQHLPQITGALETYRNSNEIGYWKIADNFWDKVTDSYMYSIGGVAGGQANAEAFVNQPDAIWTNGFARGGQNETCATYNMLKLSRQMFMYKPTEAKYMDYYEHAMYNDILASVAQNNAGNTYHIPLNPGSQKGFGNANMTGFTCCNGTAIESNTKLQDSVYFRASDNSALYVNLFVPSTLNWADKKATVKQETSYPYADTTKLTLTGVNGTDVKIRVPEWVNKGFFVKVNGADKQINATPGSYVSLGKEWRDGSTVELRMPFDFHLFRTQDQPNIASIMYGPIVLAAQEPAARQDWRAVQLDPNDLGKFITGDPSKLEFKVGDADLKPFYESYGRYSVYFDVKEPQ